MEFMESLGKWAELKDSLAEFQQQNLTETDTRCKIVDKFFCDILGWGETSISRESKVDSGFIDYEFDSPVNKFVLEAKKNRIEFRMPRGSLLKLNSNDIPKTYKELNSAISQARSYAKEQNLPFCVISNGLNFIITKSYSSNTGHDTIVIQGVNGVEKEFYKLYEILRPDADGNKVFSNYLSTAGNIRAKPLFRKTLLNEFYKNNSYIKSNEFSGQIRPYLDYYFGDVTEGSKTQILNNVYCDTDKLEGYSQELKKYLKGRIPFFGWPISPVTTNGQVATPFSEDYKMKFQQNKGHVFMLIGNLGAGKSTFLARFYHNILDEPTRKNLVWIHIDLGEYYGEKSDLKAYIEEKVFESLKRDYSDLNLQNWETLKKIYETDIKDKKDGVWFPYIQNEQVLNEKISQLLEGKLNDKDSHISRLIPFLKSKGKEVCFVFDNVDQQPADIQEEVCFYTFTKSKALESLFVVSLRDETFWNMKNKLPMDAYQNITPYQIIPPDTMKMIKKRLTLVKSAISDETLSFDMHGKGFQVNLREIFESLEITLSDDITKELFEKLASGNMRYALDLFKTLVTSGHTQLAKILLQNLVKQNGGHKKILPHDVMKSIALADLQVYESKKSKLLNMFRTFNDGFFSHFVTHKILEVLYDLKDEVNSGIEHGYVSITDLFKKVYPYCKDEESLRNCLRPLLQSYLIDSDIGSRKFGEENYYETVGYVKITFSGIFYKEVLVGNVQYLELVMQDTQITDEEVFEVIMSNLRALSHQKDLKKKWAIRFENIEHFLKYLIEQEENDMKILSSSGGKITLSRAMPNVMSLYYQNKKEIKSFLGL